MAVLFIRWWHYQHFMQHLYSNMTAVEGKMVTLSLVLIKRFIHKIGYRIGFSNL